MVKNLTTLCNELEIAKDNFFRAVYECINDVFDTFNIDNELYFADISVMNCNGMEIIDANYIMLDDNGNLWLDNNFENMLEDIDPKDIIKIVDAIEKAAKSL